MSSKRYKIEQINPELYPRIVQTVKGVFYDGNGNVITINTSTSTSTGRGVTGPQGTTGPQGLQGPAGGGTGSGSQGYQGPTGPQGLQGPAGGGTGSGSQGFQGPTGPQGFQGNQGVQGFTGPQGFQGNQGFQGPTGHQGFQGPTGPQGFQGPTGPQGSQGFQGPTGPQGSQGFQGPSGTGISVSNYQDNRLLTSDGTSDGVNAEENLTFDGQKFIVQQSNTGAYYVAEFRGNNTGARFKIGVSDDLAFGVSNDILNSTDNGYAKYNLNAKEISFGVNDDPVTGPGIPDVFTIENNGLVNINYGLKAVLSTGSTETDILVRDNLGNIYYRNDLSLTGPQGDQGFQGPTGPQGNQGFQGPTGPQGFQGNQGFQGPTGPQGNQGFQGHTGSQGNQGFQGSTGPQGNQGFQGPTGPQGNQGFQGPQGFQGQIGPIGVTGPMGSYVFSTGLTLSGTTLSVDTTVIATTATLSNYFVNGGNSFGLTATIGTIDNQNMQFNLNNTLVARFLTQSSNATTGPGSTLVAIYGNTATSSVSIGANFYINGISTAAAGTAIMTLFNSGSGSATTRPYIKLINGAAQSTWIGMLDNATSFTIGTATTTIATFNSGASILNSSASGAAQNSITVQAAHANSAGTSVALLVNNTGSNSGSGGVTSFRINNTETLGGTGSMFLMDAQRSSNTVFRIDMTGAISAGTVSNATQSLWKLGKVITATSTLDTTKYVEISIDGTTYKLCVST